MSGPRRVRWLVAAAVLLVGVAGAPSAQAAAHRFWQRSVMTEAQFRGFDRTYQADGFRLVSITMFGDPIRYSAVWIDTDGPEQLLGLGMTLGEAIAFHDRNDVRGYEPVLQAATGPANDARFSLVMERTDRDGVWHRGINQRLLDTLVDDAKDDEGPRYILASASAYGTSNAPSYSAVFKTNPDDLGWRFTRNQTYAQYADTFDGWKREGYYPDLTFVSDHVRYTGVWQVARGIGTWVGTHDLRLNEVQAAFNQWVGRGFGARHIHCGGFGAAIRCIQLFVTNRYPLDRL